jgi:muramoyltetrapeptide carboxypeptidase
VIAPPRLAKGARVALVAPAGPVPPDDLAAGRAVLAHRYQIVADDGLLAREGFLAGDDARRLAEFERVLGDESIAAIIAVRGGYGTTRLLARLGRAAELLRAQPRPLVGFSDITALLAWCLDSVGVRAIHGPVVSQLGRLPAWDAEALWERLESPNPAPPIGELRALCTGSGAARGPLAGGNLEVLTRLVGTPWQAQLGGRVLLLEDIGERPYKIDRQLTHLLAAGALDGVAGVVLGDFINCVEAPGAWPGPPSPSALEVVAERLAPLGVPVLAGAPIGHGGRNMAVALGALVELDAAAGTLTPLEAAVA